MCKGAHRGRGLLRLMCMYALTLSLFMSLSYSVLFYLQKLTKKAVFVRNGYFTPMRSILDEIRFFYFKLFFRTKVNQNAFHFNQIESYVYSIF